MDTSAGLFLIILAFCINIVVFIVEYLGLMQTTSRTPLNTLTAQQHVSLKFDAIQPRFF